MRRCWERNSYLVVNLTDCNPWFTSQHNNSMRRFAPKTDLLLDDLERKWKQKNWLVKQRWYIYNVSKLDIFAKRPNILPYNHTCQNFNFQTDTNISDARFLSKQSCNEMELILLNNIESCSQQTSHFLLNNYSLSTRFSLIYVPTTLNLLSKNRQKKLS